MVWCKGWRIGNDLLAEVITLQRYMMRNKISVAFVADYRLS